MAAKGVIAVVLLLLVGYGLLEARHLVQGPAIELVSPTSYTSYPGGFIEISGRARNTEELSLNGGPLLIDEEGRFSDTILLPSGGGILSLTATDRFGRTVTERRTIFVP